MKHCLVRCGDAFDRGSPFDRLTTMDSSVVALLVISSGCFSGAMPAGLVGLGVG